MKISKEQLKDLIKECLVEILQDGLGNVMIERKQSKPLIASRSVNNSRISQQTQALKEAIKIEAGGNPIMESIFADTAMNTLPKMTGHEATPHAGGAIETLVAQKDPEELFGDEAANKWAALAFMDVPKK